MVPSRIFLIAGICLALVCGAYMAYEWNYLRIAHSTFDNYYAFRGCRELVSRTDTAGTCKLASGETITIVEFNNKWYLQGDLPWACVSDNLCFGI